MVRRRVRVTGRVQGVFYRDSCRREALARGVAGWVQNTDDGAVEAAFEGSAQDVESMIDWCRRGPAQAVVGDVEVVEESPIGESSFAIR